MIQFSESIFDIDPNILPINIYIVAYDKTIPILNGYIEKKIDSVKDYLIEVGAPDRLINDKKSNTNGILVVDELTVMAYLIVNLNNTVAFTIDNLFVTMYNDGISKSKISNN